MDTSSVVFAAIFLAIFLGVLGRALLPYFRKALAGEKLVFELRYIAIAIASFATVWTAFPTYQPLLDGTFQTFTAAFTFGFGLQALYTEVYSWFEAGYEKVKPTSETPT